MYEPVSSFHATKREGRTVGNGRIGSLCMTQAGGQGSLSIWFIGETGSWIN